MYRSIKSWCDDVCDMLKDVSLDRARRPAIWAERAATGSQGVAFSSTRSQAQDRQVCVARSPLSGLYGLWKIQVDTRFLQNSIQNAAILQ